ncbi:MAG: hypothetical protein ACK4TA_22500, partial [Saprospiraceae bacterium]
MRILLLLLSLLITGLGYGQMKSHLAQLKKADRSYPLKDIKPLRPWKAAVPQVTNNTWFTSTRLATPQALNRPISKGSLQVTYDEQTGLPIFIAGKMPLAATEKMDWQEKALRYLEQVQTLMQIKNAAEEFTFTTSETDELGQTHLRAQQIYKGIKVYGAEIVLHGWDESIQLLNGRSYPTPSLTQLTPAISEQHAARAAVAQLSKHAKVKKLSTAELELIPGKPVETALFIYHKSSDINAEHLAWFVTIY